jgi:hypothetical protein
MPRGSRIRVLRNSSRGMPGDDLDQAPQDVHREAVLEPVARVEQERNRARRFTLSPIVPSYWRRPLATLASAYAWPRVGVPVVGEPRGVPQQVPDRDLAGRGIV